MVWLDWPHNPKTNAQSIQGIHSNSERSTLSSIQRSSNSCQKEVPGAYCHQRESLQAQRNWRLYRNKPELRSFLGLCTYYRLQHRWRCGTADQIHKGETSLSMFLRSRGRLPITEGAILYCSHSQLQAIRTVHRDRWNIRIVGVLS
jgi:hypothetical protein